MSQAAPAAPYALAGWPLDFSLSPAMHRAALAAAGLANDYQLRPTPPEALPELLASLRRGELAGLNITAPHKVAVLAQLEDAGELALGIGAVNTVLRDAEGVLRGENTDGVGFRFALEAAGALDGQGRRALLLGAGGAARAVAYVLLRAGYQLRVLARSAGQSGILAGQLYRALPGAPLSTGPFDGASIRRAAEGADLLVNATPIGGIADPSASPWPEAAAYPTGLTLIDLVAWPLETRLVGQARAAGAEAQSGLEMLVAQAARSFRLWTGLASPLAVMRAAALEAAAAAAPGSSRAGDAATGAGGGLPGGAPGLRGAR